MEPNVDPRWKVDLRFAPARWQCAICLPDDPHKSIVSWQGGLCYDSVCDSDDFPQFRTTLQPVIEGKEPSQTRQKLAGPRVPIVKTRQRYGELELESEAWAAAPGERDRAEHRHDYVAIRVHHSGEGSTVARAALRVHSVHPLTYDATKGQILHRDEPGRVLATLWPPPADVVSESEQSLLLRFAPASLSPGQMFHALVAVHCGDNAAPRATSAADAESERERASAYWRELELPYDRIRVSDPAIQALIDSSIRNIYQAREMRDGAPAFLVGPTCYRGTFAADGPFILETITYLGRTKEARAGLMAQVESDQGPDDARFCKKPGLRLWLIARHFELTRDKRWLERVWRLVEQQVDTIRMLRERTLEKPDAVNAGLMPESYPDGGIGGLCLEYSSVYWNLSGLRAAIELARARGRNLEEKHWSAEYDDFWKAFERARKRDAKKDEHGNLYVPPVLSGQQAHLPQRAAWAFLQAIYPGRVFGPRDRYMVGTMKMLEAVEREGNVYGTGWLDNGIWTYAGSFYAHALLWLGRGGKAAEALYAFANHAGPTLCWIEEQNLSGEPERYNGDMPHNWASAEFIRLVRHLLVLERGSELHLLEGLPPAWLAGGECRLVDVPTSFGEISLVLHASEDGRSITLEIDPPRTHPPERIVVHTERMEPFTDLRLDGEPCKAPVQLSTKKPFKLTLER